MKLLWIFLSNFVTGFFSMLFKLLLLIALVVIILVGFVVLSQAGAMPNLEQGVQVGSYFA